MWFFWIFTYMTQMNPLIGPILNQRALIAVKNYWGVSTYVFNTIQGTTSIAATAYSGNDGYSGLNPPDDAILFTVSGITAIADNFFDNNGQNDNFFHTG